MKLLIAIPSKNRVDILKANTLQWVKDVGVDWVVFVEPQDIGTYASVLGENFFVLNANDKGLGYCKQAIKDYALANGYTHIFKLDDDIKGFTNYRTKLKGAEIPQYIAECLPILMDAFRVYPQVKAIAFPYSFEMYERKRWEVVKRVQTAYIVETESMLVDPAISVFEDFATGLDIISKGGLVLKFGLMGIDMGVKVGGGSGGHQSFDRAERARAEIEPMRKIYPPLKFRKVDKPWQIEPDLTSISIPRRQKPSGDG